MKKKKLFFLHNILIGGENFEGKKMFGNIGRKKMIGKIGRRKNPRKKWSREMHDDFGSG